MKGLGLTAALLALAPVSSASVGSHEDLMNEIERLVILPPGAAPLTVYGRNYAFSRPGIVVGVYVIPEPRRPKNIGCSIGGRPCTEAEIRRIIQGDEARRASRAAAGQHRWFENESDLPQIADGGCGIVGVRYDVPAKRVLSIGCNGPASQNTIIVVPPINFTPPALPLEQ